MRQLDDYETLNDLGAYAKTPEVFNIIRAHIIFHVKHDGRHKARIVAY